MACLMNIINIKGGMGMQGIFIIFGVFFICYLAKSKIVDFWQNIDRSPGNILTYIAGIMLIYVVLMVR